MRYEYIDLTEATADPHLAYNRLKEHYLDAVDNKNEITGVPNSFVVFHNTKPLTFDEINARFFCYSTKHILDLSDEYSGKLHGSNAKFISVFSLAGNIINLRDDFPDSRINKKYSEQLSDIFENIVSKSHNVSPDELPNVVNKFHYEIVKMNKNVYDKLMYCVKNIEKHFHNLGRHALITYIIQKLGIDGFIDVSHEKEHLANISHMREALNSDGVIFSKRCIKGVKTLVNKTETEDEVSKLKKDIKSIEAENEPYKLAKFILPKMKYFGYIKNKSSELFRYLALLVVKIDTPKYKKDYRDFVLKYVDDHTFDLLKLEIQIDPAIGKLAGPHEAELCKYIVDNNLDTPAIRYILPEPTQQQQLHMPWHLLQYYSKLDISVQKAAIFSNLDNIKFIRHPDNSIVKLYTELQKYWESHVTNGKYPASYYDNKKANNAAELFKLTSARQAGKLK